MVTSVNQLPFWLAQAAKRLLFLVLAALFIVGSSCGARSEDAVEPRFETALYRDWLLRCASGNDKAAAERVCEIAQEATGENGIPVLVAIGRVSSSEPLTMTVRVRGTTFPSSINVRSGGPTLDLSLQWAYCLPGGCFARQDVQLEMLEKWREKSTGPKLEYINGLKQLIEVQLSNQGFAPALSALLAER